MPTFRLDKLVRTGLLKIYKDLGQIAETNELSGDELQQALIAKLGEEVSELESAGSMDLKELADILQVVQDAAIASGASLEELEALRMTREKDRGPMIVVGKNGEAKGYYVSRIVCKEGDTWVDYYRKDPQRFPEENDAKE
jgi:predicted house-cleaning noncanonical NTP pyrophosphatase (MazG superfamily)